MRQNSDTLLVIPRRTTVSTENWRMYLNWQTNINVRLLTSCAETMDMQCTKAKFKYHHAVVVHT